MSAQISETLSTWIHILFTWIQAPLTWIHPEIILTWIHLYGPIVFFVLLTLGIIVLPVPDEPLMIIAGTLIRRGDLQPIPTIMACILGAWCGITVSYCIGAYLGSYLATTRFGERVGLKGPKFIKAQQWFERIGKWFLVVGYFIPGVRHFTGYIAGSLSFPYRQFSLFAYSGGLIWASVFLTVGYTSGEFIFSTIMASKDVIANIFKTLLGKL